MARTEKKKRSRPHVRRESVRAKGRRWPSTPSTWKTAPQLDVVKDGGFPDGRYPDGSPRSRLLVSRPMTSIRSSPSFDRAPLMTEGGLGDRSESRLRGDAVFQSVIWLLQLEPLTNHCLLSQTSNPKAPDPCHLFAADTPSSTRAKAGAQSSSYKKRKMEHMSVEVQGRDGAKYRRSVKNDRKKTTAKDNKIRECFDFVHFCPDKAISPERKWVV